MTTEINNSAEHKAMYDPVRNMSDEDVSEMGEPTPEYGLITRTIARVWSWSSDHTQA